MVEVSVASNSLMYITVYAFCEMVTGFFDKVLASLPCLGGFPLFIVVVLCGESPLNYAAVISHCVIPGSSPISKEVVTPIRRPGRSPIIFGGPFMCGGG